MANYLHVYVVIFLLSLAEYEIFSADEYENASRDWLAFSYLSAEKIACPAELSTKEVL